jgi:hypothetical protein
VWEYVPTKIYDLKAIIFVDMRINEY